MLKRFAISTQRLQLAKKKKKKKKKDENNINETSDTHGDNYIEQFGSLPGWGFKNGAVQREVLLPSGQHRRLTSWPIRATRLVCGVCGAIWGA